MDEKAKILNDYIEYKKLTINNPEKERDITFHISRFLDFKKVKPKDYDEKALIDFVNSNKNDYANATLNIIKSYLKNFIKWYYIDWSARFRNLDKICRFVKSEPTYTPEDMIKESEFEKLIKEEKSIFWKAYYVTLFYGGCRASEVCKLKWKDIDFDSDKEGGAFFSIFSKKNKRSFLKFLPKEATYLLKQLQNNDSEYVFIKNNKILDRRQPYYHMTLLSKKALGKQIDLSTLRHSIATINYNKDNVKDDIVAQQMGHSKSMRNTYTHNDKEKLRANAKKIYVGELPPEKKDAYEKRIEELENNNKGLYEGLMEVKKDFEEFKKESKSRDEFTKLLIKGVRMLK